MLGVEENEIRLKCRLRHLIDELAPLLPEGVALIAALLKEGDDVVGMVIKLCASLAEHF